jgi:rhodanese-related sulfurtransferase
MGQLAEFVSSHPYLAAGVIGSLIAVIVYELRLHSQGVTQVTSNDAVKLINSGAMVIDVRAPEQYSAGHIVNARNFELTKLEKSTEVIKKPKDKVLITVCENGQSSSKAAGLLRGAGFKNVFTLKAGLTAWRADNLPLVK